MTFFMFCVIYELNLYCLYIKQPFVRYIILYLVSCCMLTYLFLHFYYLICIFKATISIRHLILCIFYSILQTYPLFDCKLYIVLEFCLPRIQ